LTPPLTSWSVLWLGYTLAIRRRGRRPLRADFEFDLVPARGFEPRTLGLKDRCSNQAELRRLNTNSAVCAGATSWRLRRSPAQTTRSRPRLFQAPPMLSNCVPPLRRDGHIGVRFPAHEALLDRHQPRLAQLG